MEKDGQIVLFDALKESDLYKIANVLWTRRNEEAQSLIGSFGVKYGFAHKWKELQLSMYPTKNKQLQKTKKMLVISGSASEITREQMKRAIERDGFHKEQIPYQLFLKDDIPYDFLKNS